jgi:hypothetical protein
MGTITPEERERWAQWNAPHVASGANRISEGDVSRLLAALEAGERMAKTLDTLETALVRGGSDLMTDRRMLVDLIRGRLSAWREHVAPREPQA